MKRIHLKSKNSPRSADSGPKIVMRLSTKLALCFLSLILIIGFGVFAGIYLRGEAIIKENAASAYLIGLQYSVEVKDSSLSGVENSTFPLLIDSRIRESLQSYPSFSQYKKYAEDQYILSKLKSIVIQNSYIDSAYLYNPVMNTLIGTNLSHTLSYSELQSSGWDILLDDPANKAMGQWVVAPSLAGSEEMTVTNFKRIFGQNNRLVGIIAINMRPDFWTDDSDIASGSFALMSIDTENHVFRSDGNSENSYTPNLPDDSGTDFYYTDGEYTVACVRSSYSGWSYLGAARTDELLDGIDSFRSTVLSATLIIVLAGSSILLFLTAHIMHPINMLKGSMEIVGTGDFTHLIDEQRNDDFQILYDGYNSMVTNLESSVQTVYRQQLEKKDLSMQILRSQIDAHFLYNTLDTVHWISELHDDTEVSNIVMHLASYYRIMLNQGRDLLTLEDCVKLIHNYLEIWQIKNDSHLSFTAEIPEDFNSAYVLKNIFQPLIENSIQHGMAGEPRPLNIVLRCIPDTENGIMKLEVEDDGSGMSEERVSEIRSQLQGEVDSGFEGGFALNNINSQIRTYYGEQFGLELESVLNSFTLIRLTIPIRWEEAQEDV